MVDGHWMNDQASMQYDSSAKPGCLKGAEEITIAMRWIAASAGKLGSNFDHKQQEFTTT